jgi:hypothetical protein
MLRVSLIFTFLFFGGLEVSGSSPPILVVVERALFSALLGFRGAWSADTRTSIAA